MKKILASTADQKTPASIAREKTAFTADEKTPASTAGEKTASIADKKTPTSTVGEKTPAPTTDEKYTYKYAKYGKYSQQFKEAWSKDSDVS